MYVRWRLDAGCAVLKHQHGECVNDSGLDRLDFKSLESDPVDYLVVGWGQRDLDVIWQVYKTPVLLNRCHVHGCLCLSLENSGSCLLPFAPNPLPQIKGYPWPDAKYDNCCYRASDDECE